MQFLIKIFGAGSSGSATASKVDVGVIAGLKTIQAGRIASG